MLIPILRAARCRSTHHFFAIDALDRIADPHSVSQAGRFRDLLLRYNAAYLKGAKDPDDKFKDFQNHVLHVADGLWGGARIACRQWLDETVECLEAQQWSDAAYACGVLSHYFTDPIMPLHTGQSEREAIVHRPMEWSICKSYEEIYALSLFERDRPTIDLDEGDDWIEQAVTQAATRAHVHYDRLIELFNLPRSNVDPKQGLGRESRQILSELFELAVGGWANVLRRIAAHVSIPLPDSPLQVATVLAGLDVPRAWIVKKFSDQQERNAVEKILGELKSTGTVRENLPLEVQVVRHQRELYHPPARDEAPGHAKDPSTATASEKLQTHVGATEPEAPSREPLLPVSISPVPHALETQSPIKNRLSNPSMPDESSRSSEQQHRRNWSLIKNRLVRIDPGNERSNAKTAPNSEAKKTEVVSANQTSPTAQTSRLAKDSPSQQRQRLVSAETFEGMQTSRLSRDSELVDAPSIGPKTAERFAVIGIATVGQFLDADPNDMAMELNTDWIKPELLEKWQRQASLVCEVPVLCGYKAQLLVAADCLDADELAIGEVDSLFQAIKQVSQTAEGQRILRSAPLPGREEIVGWIACAQRRQ